MKFKTLMGDEDHLEDGICSNVPMCMKDIQLEMSIEQEKRILKEEMFERVRGGD